MQATSEGRLHCARSVSAMPENRLPSSDIFTSHRLLHKDGAVKTHRCSVLPNKSQSCHPSACIAHFSVTSPSEHKLRLSEIHQHLCRLTVRSDFFCSLACIISLPYFIAHIFILNLTRSYKKEEQQRGRWWMSCCCKYQFLCTTPHMVRIWKTLCCMSH